MEVPCKWAMSIPNCVPQSPTWFSRTTSWPRNSIRRAMQSPTMKKWSFYGLNKLTISTGVMHKLKMTDRQSTNYFECKNVAKITLNSTCTTTNKKYSYFKNAAIGSFPIHSIPFSHNDSFDWLKYGQEHLNLPMMVDRRWPTCISLAMFGEEKSTMTRCRVLGPSRWSFGGGRTPWVSRISIWKIKLVKE